MSLFIVFQLVWETSIAILGLGRLFLVKEYCHIVYNETTTFLLWTKYFRLRCQKKYVLNSAGVKTFMKLTDSLFKQAKISDTIKKVVFRQHKTYFVNINEVVFQWAQFLR